MPVCLNHMQSYGAGEYCPYCGSPQVIKEVVTSDATETIFWVCPGCGKNVTFGHTCPDITGVVDIQQLSGL